MSSVVSWSQNIFIGTLHLHRQSGFLIGREKKVADIHMEHESVSAQHAVIQFRMRVVEQRESELDSVEYIQQINPYIMDLKSTHHTFLNGKQIEHSRYIELKEKDVLKFGGSTREYVLMKATDDWSHSYYMPILKFLCDSFITNFNIWYISSECSDMQDNQIPFCCKFFAFLLKFKAMILWRGLRDHWLNINIQMEDDL